jgi:hypothetical protein
MEGIAWMSELLLRLKQFYSWEERELRDILLSILAITFIFAFNDKAESFELMHWLMHYALTFAIVFVSFFAYDFAMKAAALHQGFRAEYRMWPMGIAISIIVTLLTKGNFYLILAGGLFVHHMMILRLGKFRYGLNVMAQGTIAAAGPVANLFLMTLSLAMARQLMIMPELFNYAAMINGYMMIYQLLPIPRLNGIHIFFMSRLAYIFIATTLVAYALLTQLKIYSWILSLLIGACCWFLWYWFFEGGKP